MIKNFQVLGLNGEFNFTFDLNADLNLLTGKNGVGKTSILKLIYYIVSGNLEKLIPEIVFDYVFLEAANFTVEIAIDRSDQGSDKAVIKWTVANETKSAEVLCKDFEEDASQLHPADFDIANASAGSIFFPTFRRIEGGFSIPETRSARTRQSADLQESLRSVAKALTFKTHSFVASISTDDIESLLTTQYADSSKRAIKLQTDLSESIERDIKGFKDAENYMEDVTNLQNARQILTDIQHRVQNLEAERTTIFKPFETLSTLVSELMQSKGVKIRDIVTFGEIKGAIEASKLSAGEKQMLSFLCYNAFVKDHIILIDEPEISLHVDWQRVLFAKLLEQGTNNQFIVATHSPFIYSKYPDREILLDKDRGDSDGPVVT